MRREIEGLIDLAADRAVRDGPPAERVVTNIVNSLRQDRNRGTCEIAIRCYATGRASARFIASSCGLSDVFRGRL